MRDGVPFTVIGGYLGVGKTTLLNHLLTNISGQRLGLLVNDFGAINIDADLIEHADDQKISLTNGCVCCGLSNGFDEAIETILGSQPDQVLLEASGVADVEVLSRYGYVPGLSPNGLVVLADAETVRDKAIDKYVGETVKRQLKAADLVVLNKTDLVKDVDAVDTWLRQIAPQAQVVRAIQSKLPVDLILGQTLGPGAGEPGFTKPREQIHAHPEYTSWLFETTGGGDADALGRFVDALPDYVLRLKGYVRFADGRRVLVQRVGSRTYIEDREMDVGTQLVAIGLAQHMDTALLDGLADKYLVDLKG
jgi:G3E family GTPase